jgi:large subunit ribosomal protein L25
VDEKAAIRVSVPLHFLNKEKSAAAKTSGVVISHNLTEVEITCLPKDLPESIELDLADLKPGDIIHLSQLKLPKNVELVAAHGGEGHDIAVVTANTVQEEAEEAPADEAAAPAAAPAAAAPAKKDDKK